MHAVLVDALADRWGKRGCARERQDRLADQQRRRIERRLLAFAAQGVTVVRTTAGEQMMIDDDAVLEVVQYDDLRGFQLCVSITAAPGTVLRALESAEDLLDDPAELGRWAVTDVGRWRGAAF